MVKTTEKYWDCECEHDYIHPKNELNCPICHTLKNEQPDSHINEVIEMLNKEYRDLEKQIDICFGRYELIKMLNIENEINELEKGE